MIQFEILSGKMAGTRHVARRFPFRIGRAAQSGLRLEEAGVWEDHAEVRFERGEGYHATAKGDALLFLNGEKVASARLRAGDVIELGAARIRFWLGDTVQRKLGPREWCTWLIVAAVMLGQVLLIYALL